jgi:hypothetical protein
MRLLSFFVLFIALASAVCASPHPFPHPSFPSGGETTSRGFEDSSSAPTVTGFSTLMGPPGQWLYVYGSNFLTGPGNTSLYLVSALSPDSISNPVPLHVYDSNSFGFTVPPNNKDTYDFFACYFYYFTIFQRDASQLS